MADTVTRLRLLSSSSTYSVDLDFDFKILRRLNGPKNRPTSTIATDKPVNNTVFSIGGTKEQIRGTAILYNTGDDISNGTLSSSSITDSRISGSTIDTRREQKIWLNEYVNGDIADTDADGKLEWKFFGLDYDDRVSTDAGIDVVVSEVSPIEEARNPLSIPVDFIFKIGKRP